jgi:RNA polymerase sigma-70 factor (ECF subfamily)
MGRKWSSIMTKKVTAIAASGWNESEAIARAQQGDAASFERLYKAHCKHVYCLCLRMLKNTAEAEDLTQQVFLQLFRKIATFRGDSSFSTWLHRISVNAVLMHLRRKRPADGQIESLDDSAAGSVDSDQLADASTGAPGVIDSLNLKRAIRLLPAGYKRFFLLHDVMGYQHREIAAQLGCSVGCSKSQLHKARKSLRRLLQGEPVGKGGAERRPELQRNADLLNQVVTRAASREESSTEYFCAEPNYLTSS